MKKFCIITNPEKDKEYKITSSIEKYLSEKGLYSYRAVQREGMPYGFIKSDCIEKDTDYAIVLGGDGTLLHAAKDLSEYDVPILGINHGTLGFLVEVEQDKIFDAIERIITGDYCIEEHMMLHAKAKDKEMHLLNDVVISCKGYSQLIRLQMYINGVPMQLYSGDGVLVATPTGSTAYNLSAGGPVLSHGSKMMVMTPICPHSLGNRSLVISDSEEITFEFVSSRPYMEDEAGMTIDGMPFGSLKDGEKISICRSDRTTKLIRFEKEAFYKALRSKLGWGNN